MRARQGRLDEAGRSRRVRVCVFGFVLFICLFEGAQRVRMWDAACGLDDR